MTEKPSVALIRKLALWLWIEARSDWFPNKVDKKSAMYTCMCKLDVISYMHITIRGLCREVEVTQEPQKDSSNQQYQIYDSTFKEWVSQQADVILPTLLPGAVYEETISTELVLPTKR